ncbi:trypsin Inhibitor like cysteine rich domain protein [Ancylostoma ceylanicum]|uniref:Trypsin Inhibitor like cysteine rich domain protein n=2 Tax=Ancylostoma ceylanicum TaxID=53326 RepID=A0A0D6LYJ2_9BILA|nr:trypsin Inhibitor like cysteine rich domain protein [Ancylostoma ceylanicum]EYC45798.1 hypothetical protein Y032_0416g1079 [Ancylostoma ceylanicum]
MLRAVVILLTATIFIASCEDRRCGVNEQFYECGSACEPKCNVPDPVVCTMQCIVNVCQCKPGYKRGPNGCRRPGPGCK